MLKMGNVTKDILAKVRACWYKLLKRFQYAANPRNVATVNIPILFFFSNQTTKNLPIQSNLLVEASHD